MASRLENVYHNTGDYCGLSAPNPLDDRLDLGLTCPPGPRYNDRPRNAVSQKPHERNAHRKGSNKTEQISTNDDPVSSCTQITSSTTHSSVVIVEQPRKEAHNAVNPVSNMNKVKERHHLDIKVVADHAVARIKPLASPRIKELKEGVASPARPHSLDVPEKKSRIKRTFSAPQLGSSNDEKHSRDDRKLCNTKNLQRHVRYDAPGTYSRKGNVTSQGKRSKSLPSVSLPRGFKLKPSSTRDRDPLRYFAYLGKRFQFQERLPSAHNVVCARPVILTSTSVIAPEVSTNFRDQLEAYDGSSKYQGTCQDLVDCCTCMCCVKAVFYHCTKDDYSEGEVAAHPCLCSKPIGQCLARWSILGLFTACMPCLMCYLPIQGCKRGVEYLKRESET